MLTKKLFNKLPIKNFSTIWGHVKPRPADPILGIVEEFKKDTSTNKVNLSAGTYKDTDNNSALKEQKIAGCQALSGTGSLRIGMEFLAEHYKASKNVLIPNPSWPNHKNIVARANLTSKEYRYYDFKNKSLDINGLLEDLDKADNESIVVLHVCAHNPTGMDPSESQWKDILNVVQKKKHFPFFDMAYQGFSSGNLDKDAYALRLFAEQGVRLALAQSYAKNFGLYGQRVGCLSVVTDSKSEADAVQSNIKFIARAQYSNPPKYGAHLVDIVLSNPSLNTEWHRELKIMADRISSMRQALYDNIVKQGSKHNWEHIIKQIGMFAYTGLNKDQVNRLKSEFHIYLTDDGRISISGLNTKNVEYVAKSFHEVSK